MLDLGIENPLKRRSKIFAPLILKNYHRPCSAGSSQSGRRPCSPQDEEYQRAEGPENEQDPIGPSWVQSFLVPTRKQARFVHNPKFSSFQQVQNTHTRAQSVLMNL